MRMDVLGDAPWNERLDKAVAMIRELSQQSDPESLVDVYSRYSQQASPIDAFISVTRRDIAPPKYRIARFSGWDYQPNPWRERNKLPIFEGGLLGELSFCNEPRIIRDLELDPDDPCAAMFEGMRSLQSVPIFDGGDGLNVAVQLRKEPDAFNVDLLPQTFWMTNLFARGTHNLVLSRELKEAHDRLDREIEVVASIQETLLPEQLPHIDGVDLAVYYRASHRAGGDYYDIFPLEDGRFGVLVADVSGHGPPAAVLMAITHALSHLYPGTPDDPALMLEFLSRHLYERYTSKSSAFVTAVYGVYDSRTREFEYALAGHPPPRLKHCDDGTIDELTGVLRPPLGIFPEQKFENARAQFRSGDQFMIYTDGITEAHGPNNELFGTDRIDAVLRGCSNDAHRLKDQLIAAVHEFTRHAPQADDTTLLVGKVD